MYPFKISEELLKEYRRLRFDEKAEHQYCLVPFGTIVWPDEHPDEILYESDEKSMESIFRLVAARTVFWETEQIPAELEMLWEEANRLLPEWPGFRRLYLDSEQRKAAEEFEREIIESYESLFEQGYEIAFESKGGGVVKLTITIPLREQETEKPWWKFWG